jgi:S1-C subfamily serine protease
VPAWLAAFVWLIPGGPTSPPAVEPAPLSRVLAAEAHRRQVIEKVGPAVACVFARDSRAGGGSGVIIDEHGYGLTNFHVIAGMLQSRIGEIGLPDGKLRDIDILGIDPGGDVAMFRVRGGEALMAAPLGDSDGLRIGDPVLAMGNPFGLSEDYAPTVTLGIVSGLHRYQKGIHGALTYTDCIQVDASINPGNSGGPLFDLDGRLIGINGRVAIEERGRVNVGVGFAIGINQIKRFIPMMRAGLAVPHASAGFTVVDENGVVVVDQIDEDCGAYRAGLRGGDRVESFAGVRLNCANQFLSVLGTFPGDWPIEVAYRRGDTTRRFDVRLEAAPLPRLTRRDPANHPGAFDPYAPHPTMQTANRLAVKRLFRRLHESAGGAAALKNVRSVEFRGICGAKGKSEATPIVMTLGAAHATGADGAATPEDYQASILWTLMTLMGDPADAGYRVVAADQVNDRIAAVLENENGDRPPYRAWIDDENGHLLAIEFKWPHDGRRYRFQYDELDRSGPLKLPRRRIDLIDGRLTGETRFDEITVAD